MNPSPASAAPARPAARPARKKRPQGQWKVDGKQQLNPVEVLKATDDGLNVRQRIIDVYSKEGFASIPPEDLNGRFRWMGLYTQRKPGIDGARTAKLTPEEMSDEYFMMRIRLDGGAITTDQLRVIASLSTEFARDTADITDRQNIQLHWVRVEDVPEIWDRLDASGMDSIEACGDVPRVVVGSAVAGIAVDEIIDPSPVIAEIREKYIGSPEFSNLPRKYKTSFTGHPSLDAVHEINDVSFVGVRHPELGPGYDLWVGGGLSTVPHLAKRIGVFVTQEEAAEVWWGVTSIFRDYGYRGLRTRNRLKFLIQDWGVEKFRQVLQDEYLDRELPDGPAPERANGNFDHIGVHPQSNGKVWVGVAPTVGRVSGTILAKVADLAEQAGSGRIRFTVHQKLLILDVDPAKADELIAQLAKLKLYATPSIFRRGTMACTGIEYCKLAFVDTKADAATLVGDLEERLADLDLGETKLSINLNGCPNSCARIQVADIGLKGQILAGEPGYQVHLGGSLADSPHRTEGELGRTVRGLRITTANLADWAERVIRRYAADRAEGETFAEWSHRAEEEALS